MKLLKSCHISSSVDPINWEFNMKAYLSFSLACILGGFIAGFITDKFTYKACSYFNIVIVLIQTVFTCLYFSNVIDFDIVDFIASAFFGLQNGLNNVLLETATGFEFTNDGSNYSIYVFYLSNFMIFSIVLKYVNLASEVLIYSSIMALFGVAALISFSQI